jgi:hypothetical protein
MKAGNVWSSAFTDNCSHRPARRAGDVALAFQLDMLSDDRRNG